MASLQGKVFVLTGGASGIGRATAQVLAKREAALSLADVNKAGLDEVLKTLPGNGHSATVVDDETDEIFKRIMSTNAFGVFHCLRAQLNHIGPPGGSIVNVASAAGLTGFEKLGSYGASKHAVIGLTKAAAKENENIRVNAIAPSGVETPLLNALSPPDVKASNVKLPQVIQRAVSPVEIANIIAFLLSDDASYITGVVYPVDGGYTA